VFARILPLDSVVGQMSPIHILKNKPIILFKFYSSLVHWTKWTVHSVDNGYFLMLSLVIVINLYSAEWENE